jgi:hypothetical protein
LVLSFTVVTPPNAAAIDLDRSIAYLHPSRARTRTGLERF